VRTGEQTDIIACMGGQLIVFRGDHPHLPFCTATDRSGKNRCGESLSRLDYSGWDEVHIAGTEGEVTILRTGLIGDECWIRQRCPEHLACGQALLAPEWMPFDPVRDADLIRPSRPLWTPEGGVIGRPTGRLPDGDREETREVIALAFATRVEPVATTALYRWFDEKDRLLYVGITDDLLWRVQSHILESSWMDYAARSTIVRYPTRKDAADAETAAIKAEQPLFNKVHNRTPEAQLRLVEFLVEHGHAGRTAIREAEL